MLVDVEGAFDDPLVVDVGSWALGVVLGEVGSAAAGPPHHLEMCGQV